MNSFYEHHMDGIRWHYQVHDAGLYDCLRKHRGDLLGKPLEAINDGDEDVVDAARLEFVDNLEPK